MKENKIESLSSGDQERLDGFLDCIALQIAKRWLKEQRSIAKNSSNQLGDSEPSKSSRLTQEKPTSS